MKKKPNHKQNRCERHFELKGCALMVQGFPTNSYKKFALQIGHVLENIIVSLNIFHESECSVSVLVNVFTSFFKKNVAVVFFCVFFAFFQKKLQ